MCYRKFLLIIFFLIFNLKAFSAVFLVTSNADSGTGTLREALTLAAANGTAEKDYINFNISNLSEPGRTIILKSQLPLFSSNLVIDGSTQPGNKFVVGDARVCITVDRFAYNQQSYGTAAFVLSQNKNVEIYGFYILGFYYLNINIGSGAATNAGIIIAGCQNIQIGAPGKGNWIANCNYGILGGTVGTYSNAGESDIKLQSNYMGFETGPSGSQYGASINGNNISVGGDGPNEANHCNNVINISGSGINIVHNYLGLDANDNVVSGVSGNLVCSGTNAVIKNNISGFFFMQLIGLFNFSVYGNQETANGLSTSTPAILVQNCKDGIIGSDDITQINLLQSSMYFGRINNNSSQNIQILKNSVICSSFAYATSIDKVLYSFTLPVIQVLTNNDTEYSGTASPNSTVYIYQDNTGCEVCSPVEFYTKVTADANGKWGIKGSFANKKWVANTLLDKNSSEFTQPNLSFSSFDQIQTQPTCGSANGSIKLQNLKHVLKVIWYDSNDKKIGDGLEINNLPAGTYYARCYNGNCSVKTPIYTLYDSHPVLFPNFVQIKNPTCGQKNGAIKGLNVAPIPNKTFTVQWTDLTGKIVGTANDIDNLGPGTYLFTFISNCNVTYGPITLKNTTGPNIDQSKQSIQPSACGTSTGSITQITATGTGTLTHTWKNSQQQIVGSSADLVNQPAGKYTLQVADQSNCGIVYSSEITIPETNSITLDVTGITKTPSTCRGADGSITGILAPGATNYKWIDAAGNTVSTELNLINVAAGKYYLLAYNSTCSKQTPAYEVLQHFFSRPSSGLTIKPNDATCNLNNGSIEVIWEQTNAALPASYRWINNNGQTVGGNSLLLQNLDEGSYSLYGTDADGCEGLIVTQPILRVAPLAMQTGIRINDQCNTKTGSVKGIQVSGGKTPYVYNWKDATGQQVGQSADITNLASGTYMLQITDAAGCTLIKDYYIDNQDATIPAPGTANFQLCGPGDAIISISGAIPGYSYKLYGSSDAVNPISVQTDPRFKVNIKQSTQFFVSQANGTCESTRTPLKITVGLTSFSIVNTFTPNGDGNNDAWKITGIENYQGATVQVYNRQGNLVYNSVGYSTPFDGRQNGKQLPMGVYYYIINLNSKCDLISGSVTIIR